MTTSMICWTPSGRWSIVHLLYSIWCLLLFHFDVMLTVFNAMGNITEKMMDRRRWSTLHIGVLWHVPSRSVHFSVDKWLIYHRVGQNSFIFCFTIDCFYGDIYKERHRISSLEWDVEELSSGFPHVWINFLKAIDISFPEESDALLEIAEVKKSAQKSYFRMRSSHIVVRELSFIVPVSLIFSRAFRIMRPH